jgi:glucose/arabinose dehydrogenase
MPRHVTAAPAKARPRKARDVADNTQRFRRLGLERLEQRLALASSLPPGFTETVVATNIIEPNSMTLAPDGRIFVTEKRTGIRVIENGVVLPTRFVTLTVEQGGERGVQNVIFDPNYAVNGYVYVYYTRFASSGSYDRLSRFQANPANPNVALPGETVIIDKIPTVAPGFHNGGFMEFGADGMLYLGIGDLGSSTNVQSLNTINGKILRLNAAAFDPTKPIDVGTYNPAVPNPLVPADNPFVNTPGAWPIVYAYGVRNPFTGDIKPGTSTIYINDVGGGIAEEINQLAAGANYGWPVAEGPSSNPAFTNPTFSYPHVPVGSGAAIAGGGFYTGSAFPSAYHNTYFYSDYVLGFIRNFNPATGTSTPFASDVFIPVDIDQGPDGSLYWLSHGPGGGAIGSVYKITYTPTGNQAPTAVATATSPTSGLPPLTVRFYGA